MTEDDGMRVATLEVEFAELDGYTAESRAGEFLSGAGIEESLHFGPMSEVAPGLETASTSGTGAVCFSRHSVA